MRLTIVALFVSAVLPASFVVPVCASPITAGNLVVYRVGGVADPTTPAAGTLAADGNPVFIDEYTPTGVFVQSLAMPTTASGGNNQLIAGSSPTEGLLTVSSSGQHIALTGFAADLGGGTALNGNNGYGRTVGIISVATGLADTSTALTDVAINSHPRSAVTTDGTNIWVQGNGGGVRYTTLGSTTSTQLVQITPRQLNIFDGQLYSDTSGGVGTVGTGVPTTAGQTFSILPGTAPAGSSTDGFIGFFFADLDVGVPGVDTLYVAGDDALALTKYSLVGGTWTSNGTIGVDDNYAGITGVVSGSTVSLYITRFVSSSTAGGGELLSLVDSSGYNGAFAGTPTILATAASNTAFRGVGVIPVPEPSAALLCVAALVGLAGMKIGRRRR